jgi:protein TonB
VLLTQDESLVEALLSSVPPDCLTVVSDEAALASHLMSDQVGVVFIDADSPHSPPGARAARGQLIQRLYNQLPDVVLVVAGDGAAQSELAPLVTDGTIYRFVHKPVSAQRVKLFVDAAWRKRGGGSASGVYPALSMPQLPPSSAPPRSFAWPALVAGAVVVVAGAAWLLRSHAPTGANSPPQSVAASAAARERAASLPAAAREQTPSAPPGSSSSATAGTTAELDRLAIAARQARARARRAAALAAAAAPSTTADSSAPAAPAPVAITGSSVAAAASSPTPAPASIVAPDATTSAANTARPSPPATAPSSTPPASEARDRDSLAAVILQRIYSVDPVFPEIARQHDLTGFVDLEFTVRADGSVTDVTVLKAQPAGIFEKSAVAAVSQWRYRPIERNGVPVNEHARLRLNFAYQ